uniref:hypothetical protein n=1 Tax=uncultured Rhizobium sp. TaxID=155567 RepID=UPI00262A30D3|nr:hypothetical protein [uncultured Rhizobium sp.]
MRAVAEIIDKVSRFLTGRSLAQLQVLKALDKLEPSFRAEDVFASAAMRETVRDVKLEVQRDGRPVAIALSLPGATPVAVAAKLLLDDVRRQLNGERGAIALTGKVKGLMAIEEHTALHLRSLQGSSNL